MNLLDLLEELNIEYKRLGEHHHTTSRFLAQIDCPWCDTTGHYHLGVNESFCACWKCGSHTLYETLFEITGSSVPQLKDLEASELKTKLHNGQLKLPQGIVPLMPVHKRYLLQRKFNPDKLVKLWKIQGLGQGAGIKRNDYWDALSWRIFIPIYQDGDIVSWTTRSISKNNSSNRYSTALASESKQPRAKILYGLDLVKWAVVCVEGPTDVWAIGPGAVATLGTGYAQEQTSLLLKYPIRYILYDNEPAAQNRARQLCDYLSAFEGQTYNLQLDAKDPASASKKELKKLRHLLKLD